jgi:hypothetical protein
MGLHKKTFSYLLPVDFEDDFMPVSFRKQEPVEA